jgi:hypothetical protein
MGECLPVCQGGPDTGGRRAEADKLNGNVGVNINWDEQHVGTKADPRTNSMVSRENLDSVLVSGLPAAHYCDE